MQRERQMECAKKMVYNVFRLCQNFTFIFFSFSRMLHKNYINFVMHLYKKVTAFFEDPIEIT